MLSLSNEKSFHRCTLLSLPTLPPVQTSITIKVGYTTVACTSHKTCGGEEVNPVDEKVEDFKMEKSLRATGCRFLFTIGIQCLVADGPQVLGLSLWFYSGTKQQSGL